MQREDFLELDQQDVLAPFRDEFSLPPDLVYLNGNSLGAMPAAAVERARRTVENEWGEGLIGSMNSAGWYHLPVTLGKKLARLIGADPNEVVVTDATGINLYKVMGAALALRPDRRIIVMEGTNFPTNNYVVQGLIDHLGKGHRIRFVEKDELKDAIDDQVAVACLTHVHYRTGHLLDMAALTSRAHEVGAVTVWDLCHSAGALPVLLNDCNVDFAVGCTYKYLNGGPGSPAFVFAARRLHGNARQPLTGWFGHADPFAFERDYRPDLSVKQMLSGTPPIVSLAVADVGIDMMGRADLERVREKSIALTELFVQRVEAACAGYGLSVVSPRDPEQRGSHVCLHHEQGYPIVQALRAGGITGDYREPGFMRFAFAPLYNRYSDVWDASDGLRQVLQSESWRDPVFRKRAAVT